MPPSFLETLARGKEQWAEHGWGDPEVMAAFVSVSRMQRLISALIDNALAPLDLSYARYDALGVLYFASSKALPLGEMSQRLGVHPATVTSLVDRLEKQSLVRRVRPDDDRRVVLAEMLPAGEALVEKAFETLGTTVFPQIPWSKRDLQHLFNLFAKMLEVTGESAAPRG